MESGRLFVGARHIQRNAPSPNMLQGMQLHPGSFLNLASVSVQHVHGTPQSRVKGADHAPDIDRT